MASNIAKQNLPEQCAFTLYGVSRTLHVQCLCFSYANINYVDNNCVTFVNQTFLLNQHISTVEEECLHLVFADLFLNREMHFTLCVIAKSSKTYGQSFNNCCTLHCGKL